MPQKTASPGRRSNSYNIFILVLTILSLVIMVVMLLPLDATTLGLLQVYDNLICVIFLVDFFFNLWMAPRKSDYFIKERGWLDLLGSIPSPGTVFKYAGLIRLARLSRLARIARLLGRQQRGDLIRDIVQNRSQYTAFITILLTLIVLTSTSVLVLQYESQSPDGNIKSGWDSLWFSVVTITTVGYGDRYPVTVGGRITAIFIMLMGVGLIGALASILSSVLVGRSPATSDEVEPVIETTIKVEKDIAAIKDELTALRRLLEEMSPEAEGDEK